MKYYFSQASFLHTASAPKLSPYLFKSTKMLFPTEGPLLARRSVTILDNLFHFGQLFKAFGNYYFSQITHIFIHFSSVIMFGELL